MPAKRCLREWPDATRKCGLFLVDKELEDIMNKRYEEDPLEYRFYKNDDPAKRGCVKNNGKRTKQPIMNILI